MTRACTRIEDETAPLPLTKLNHTRISKGYSNCPSKQLWNVTLDKNCSSGDYAQRGEEGLLPQGEADS